jgi:putative heme iron utilization protein
MPVDKRTDPAAPAPVPSSESPAAVSRRLLRTALKAALATLEDGHPYASLVLVATEPDGAPVLLISRLAVHTRNIEKDPRATLLFDGTGEEADPLSGARVTVRGTLRKTDKPQALRRFLARHPSAEGYASFADFGTYVMDVTGAHFIGGFGRIVDIPRSDLLVPLDGAEGLMEAEPEILAHIREDHADAVQLYAGLAGEAREGWRMSGIDPEGIDLVRGPRAARVLFDGPVRTPGEARRALAALAASARGAS